MNRHASSQNLAWIDLEMTGLHPEEDVILQAALIVTDANLQILEEMCFDVWQPPDKLLQMTPFVRSMHDKSGLLSRIASSTHDLAGVERKLLASIAGWCSFPATLAGNSVGQDKRFIEQYMKGLAGYLNYRMLDVTTLKLLVRLWHGDEAVYKKPEEGAHDALFDIRQSIAELAYYRAHFWRGEASSLIGS